MLSHDGKPVDPPPSYNHISLPGWYHHTINRKQSEDIIRNYIDNNQLDIYADRLFLVRQKDNNMYAISIYRYISDKIYHHLLENCYTHFVLDNSIIINQTNLVKVIDILRTDISIGYKYGEIIPLCNNYVISHQQH
jgi:hypothetical protein